jgi:amidase
MNSDPGGAPDEGDDPTWWSARRIAAAIRDRQLSSRELLDHLVERTHELDGPVNSVVRWDVDRAMEAAVAADRAVTNGESLGPLHGVPMTVKDSFETAGCVTTSGAPELADHVPERDAWPVARLRAAGAIPFAKSNVPIWADDLQSYNDVYGTTSNPHDPTRTPGGSSGGAGAALAMGFTPIELGSDIGGSIRCPAHYCGVVGLKPSYGIVPGHGQIPGLPGTLSLADIAVVGPMARSVPDLVLMLDVLAGPDRWSTPAWRLELPPSPVEHLAEARIAAWIDDEHCPVDSDTRRVLEDLTESLTGYGAQVDHSARPGFDLAEVVETFHSLLFAAESGGHPRDKIEHLAATVDDTPLGRIKRLTAMRHRDWLSANERRLQLRMLMEGFFDSYDVLLLPVQPCPAIPHDHSQPQFAREVVIDGAPRPYLDLFAWSALAGVLYLPAVVVPVGASADGLPIGVQVVGPFLHDRLALSLAGLVSDLCGGCPRPAGAG